MKKLLLTGLVSLSALCGYSEDLPADDILAFVRSSLPNEPLTLTGTLKIKAPNGFTRASMPVEMELDWGAAVPTAIYRIGEPGSRTFQSLTITWPDGKPEYLFSDPGNKPTSDILESGLTWADLSFSVFWWPGSRLVDEGRKINRECYIVDVPVPDSENTMRLWIEKSMGMLLEARTLDGKGEELNCLNIVSIKKMDGMWIAKDLKIDDRKSGNQTLLQISDLEWKNGPPQMAPEESATAFDPAESVNQLAIDLYRKLASQDDGNLFFSPYSISAALAMTYGGARGGTAEQMNKVLHLGGPDATHPAFSHLRTTLDKIQGTGNIELAVANALWPQKDYAFLPAYLDLTEKYYDSEIRPVDYRADTEGARSQINGWVEEQTHDRIRNLIADGILNNLTRLVLVNAIYFKGSWAARFDTGATHSAPFHLSGNLTGNATVQVPMMSQKDDYALAETDAFQALELPYEGGDLSMLVLLPSATNTLAALENELTLSAVADLPFRKEELNVQLPRFKLESSFGLSRVLKEMGMPEAFSSDADFSGMDGTRNLYLSAVLHKAFVEVNEEGTEAAAATAAVIGLRSMPRPPRQFIADHPFLFFIRENSTGTILFMGRVTDPSK